MLLVDYGKSGLIHLTDFAGSADGSSACGPAARAPGIYLPQNTKVTIRFRQGGEIFHPAGRVGSHPLKKLFQEWQVPPWMRDRIPLVYFDDKLAMVVGCAVAEGYIASDHVGVAPGQGSVVTIEMVSA